MAETTLAASVRLHACRQFAAHGALGDALIPAPFQTAAPLVASMDTGFLYKLGNSSLTAVLTTWSRVLSSPWTALSSS